jgi:hypothetical protein
MAYFFNWFSKISPLTMGRTKTVPDFLIQIKYEIVHGQTLEHTSWQCPRFWQSRESVLSVFLRSKVLVFPIRIHPRKICGKKFCLLRVSAVKFSDLLRVSVPPW